jgi:hypothetical protein
MNKESPNEGVWEGKDVVVDMRDVNMQTQKINIAQTQTGANRKTQYRKDSSASLRYSTTPLWQE